VIEWDATLKALVLKVAWPAVRVPVPRVVAPSLKVTVPVAAAGATVAVKVTDWPKTDGLTEEVTVVVVEATPTTCDRVELVLAVKLVSAPYVAVMG
jgi:hypothetical protein